ncbi:MAG: hypothetical protein K9K67_13010 [Bacteriovoracaceae bacterium]|nr:hypothetical protein [Bacteriovoracaceae bacterium]
MKNIIIILCLFSSTIFASDNFNMKCYYSLFDYYENDGTDEEMIHINIGDWQNPIIAFCHFDNQTDVDFDIIVE